MNEIGKPEQTRNELASFLIMFCKYILVVDYVQSVYQQVFLIEWFVIIEYFLKMLSRFASGALKKIQVLSFNDMPSQFLSPRFMNSKGANKYLHCTVVKFCIVFDQIQP